MTKLAAYALLAMACSIALVSSSNGQSYQVDLDDRSGHFAHNYPLIDMYKNWIAVYEPPKTGEGELPDNYRPSNYTCINFLTAFRSDEYKIYKVDDFIRVDACLGLLYKKDVEGLDGFKKDEQLKKLYEGTTLPEWGQNEKLCLANLLNAALALVNQVSNKQNRVTDCDSNWLQLYIQYAECTEDSKGYEKLRKRPDSYVKFVDNFVHGHVHECFYTEISHVNKAIEAYYQAALPNRAKNTILQFGSSYHKLAHERKWPMPLMRIMTVALENKVDPNPREVHKLIKGTYDTFNATAEHPEANAKLRDILFEHIAHYVRDYKLRRHNKKQKKVKKPSEMDPNGLKMYENVVDNLCQFFRTTSSLKNFDYPTSIIRLNRLLRHPKVFGITDKQFQEDIMARAGVVAPVYFAASLCNILSKTIGSTKGPEKDDFVVRFMDNAEKSLVIWPPLDYY